MLTAEQEIMQSFEANEIPDIMGLKERFEYGLIDAIERLFQTGQITPEYVGKLNNYIDVRRLAVLYLPYQNEAVMKMVDIMKAEIIGDVKAGRVPATVKSYSELHDHVDANMYGGQEGLYNQVMSDSDTEEEHTVKLNKLTDVAGPAMVIVDRWIKLGGINAGV